MGRTVRGPGGGRRDPLCAFPVGIWPEDRLIPLREVELPDVFEPRSIFDGDVFDGLGPVFLPESFEVKGRLFSVF